MPKLVNKSARVIHVGDGMLSPGGEGEFSPEEMKMPMIKAMLEANELVPSTSADKAPPPKPPAAPVEQQAKTYRAMATAEEWLGFFYPYLMDDADPRRVPLADIDMALAVALDYRPTCLAADRQNQAQAHYTAYLLEYRARVAALAAAVGGTVTETVAGPVIEKQEGDLRIRYATSGGTTNTSAQIKANLTGPNTPYAAWEKLWALCAGETVEGQVPVRRGGLITRYGIR